VPKIPEHKKRSEVSQQLQKPLLLLAIYTKKKRLMVMTIKTTLLSKRLDIHIAVDRERALHSTFAGPKQLRKKRLSALRSNEWAAAPVIEVFPRRRIYRGTSSSVVAWAVRLTLRGAQRQFGCIPSGGIAPFNRNRCRKFIDPQLAARSARHRAIDLCHLFHEDGGAVLGR